MTPHFPQAVTGVVVEDGVVFTVTTLCQASGATADQLYAWVGEGVLEPLGPIGPLGNLGNLASDAMHWQFSGSALARMRMALRLTRDFELGAAGLALVMDLLEEIHALRGRPMHR